MATSVHEPEPADADLTLTDKTVPWTGGTFSLKRLRSALDLFSSDTYSWRTSPVSIGLQPVLVWLQQPEVGPAHRTIRYHDQKPT